MFATALTAPFAHTGLRGLELFGRDHTVAVGIDAVKHLCRAAFAPRRHLVLLQQTVFIVVKPRNHAGSPFRRALGTKGRQLCGGQSAVAVGVHLGKAGFPARQHLFKRHTAIAICVKRCKIRALAVVFCLCCTCSQNEAGKKRYCHNLRFHCCGPFYIFAASCAADAPSTTRVKTSVALFGKKYSVRPQISAPPFQTPSDTPCDKGKTELSYDACRHPP